jgi:hypothetical protein
MKTFLAGLAPKRLGPLGVAQGVAHHLQAAWICGLGRISKTVNGGFVVRGFESLPLRCSRRKACKIARCPSTFPFRGGSLTGRHPASLGCPAGCSAADAERAFIR